MKIDELKTYGFPETVLKIWKESESNELLPVQEVAVMEGILDGKNRLS